MATRWVRWLSAGLGVLAVGALIGWAAATVLTPNREVLNAAPYTTVAVSEGEVGSSLNLGAIAEWTPEPVGVNRAAGVVTSVAVQPADEVGQGSRLYEVNLRPVFVAQGSVPAFRPLAQGMTGSDVAQLQGMLAAAGHFAGTPDGDFGAATTRAVRAWQTSVGLPVDGVVALGDLVFVPNLPTRVTLDDEVVYRDATLSGGEPVLRGLASAPEFTMTVTTAQAAMMPIGASIQLRFGEQVWEATAGEQTLQPESGSVVVALDAVGEGPICGEVCGELPVTEPSQLSATVITVPTVAGLVVPSAALATRADGSLVLRDEAGTEHPVTVVAQARGMSVVEGVDEGLSVRVPGE